MPGLRWLRRIPAPGPIDAASGSILVLRAVLLVAFAMHVALLGALEALPFQDAPDHLARAVAIGDLWLGDGGQYGKAFSFEPQFVPYILGDLALSALTRAMPADVAGRVWMVLLFASLPLAVAVYLRTLGYSPSQTLLGVAVALYLSVDWFFVLGMTAYRLGVACMVVGLAACYYYMDRPSPIRLLLVTLGVVTSYLSHLSSFFFLCLAIAVLVCRWVFESRARLRHVLALACPFAVVAVVYLLGPREPPAAMFWGTVVEKVRRLVGPFVTFGYFPDLLWMGLLGYCLLRLFGRVTLRDRQTTEALWIALVFLAAYVALPIGRGKLYDVDARALPLAVLFVLFAALRSFPGTPRLEREVVIVVVILLLGHVAQAAYELLPANVELRRYREVARALPVGSTFLPINTRPPRGRTQPFMTASSWATIDRRAITPYHYTAGQGSSMTYFDAHRPLYGASPFWYVRNESAPDWRRVERDYRYVLITEPFDGSRIGVRGRCVVCTRTASLLELDTHPAAGAR